MQLRQSENKLRMVAWIQAYYFNSRLRTQLLIFQTFVLIFFSVLYGPEQKWLCILICCFATSVKLLVHSPPHYLLWELISDQHLIEYVHPSYYGCCCCCCCFLLTCPLVAVYAAYWFLGNHVIISIIGLPESLAALFFALFLLFAKAHVLRMSGKPFCSQTLKFEILLQKTWMSCPLD